MGIVVFFTPFSMDLLSAWTNWVRMFQIDEFNLMSGMPSFTDFTNFVVLKFDPGTKILRHSHILLRIIYVL